jgi:hypothetical protein
MVILILKIDAALSERKKRGKKLEWSIGRCAKKMGYAFRP